MLWATPGSSVDARGFVSLYDVNDHLLQRARIPMIQMAEIIWYSNSVEVSSMTWELSDLVVGQE